MANDASATHVRNAEEEKQNQSKEEGESTNYRTSLDAERRKFSRVDPRMDDFFQTIFIFVR